MREVRPGLFVGDMRDASDPAVLRAHGIARVLSLAPLTEEATQCLDLWEGGGGGGVPAPNLGVPDRDSSGQCAGSGPSEASVSCRKQDARPISSGKGDNLQSELAPGRRAPHRGRRFLGRGVRSRLRVWALESAFRKHAQRTRSDRSERLAGGEKAGAGVSETGQELPQEGSCIQGSRMEGLRGAAAKKAPRGSAVETPSGPMEERKGPGSGIQAARAHLVLPLLDMAQENLLEALPHCLDFIAGRFPEKAESVQKNGDMCGVHQQCTTRVPQEPSGGAVLVHCSAGVSRSCAVVLAHLMGTEGLSLKAALESLQSSVPSACPNDGFMHQLALFRSMGCHVDRADPRFKAFKLSLLAGTAGPGTWTLPGNRRAGSLSPQGQKPMEGLAAPEHSATGAGAGRGEGTAAVRTETKPGEVERALESKALLKSSSGFQPAAPEARAVGESLFRCRKCRSILASEANVIPHARADGVEAQEKEGGPQGPGRDRQAHPGSAAAESSGLEEHLCSSVFVEPLKWMQLSGNDSSQMEGKLSCFKCQSRVGSFTWVGVRCRCGAWVSPAFQLHWRSIDSS